MTVAVQNMGVDHRRTHVFVAQELLDGADVIARFQQMRGERMAERVANRVLDDAGFANGPSNGALHQRLVDVVAAILPRSAILPATLLGKGPLPSTVALLK
jgi:hypothetical protein